MGQKFSGVVLRKMEILAEQGVRVNTAAGSLTGTDTSGEMRACEGVGCPALRLHFGGAWHTVQSHAA